MNNVTVLFPGGFKPLTGAHLALAQRYAEQPNVEKVILLIGEKSRGVYTRQNSIDIFQLANSNSKIEIQPTPFNSPIMAAYEYLFELPEDTTGVYAMAASSKDEDSVRVMDFTSNVVKYQTVGDKKGRKMPAGITAETLDIDTEPLKYPDGTPISATKVRAAIESGDYKTFRLSYPNLDEPIVKQIWNIVKQTNESIFSIDWWNMQLNEDIDLLLKQLHEEGYPDSKTTKRHSKKINKLRSFLNKNKGKEFVYNFDNFDRTTFGASLKENYITAAELKQIESAVDSFFKQYGIDVNFQGRVTHFRDRLNDPRNESPIYIHELESLFADLASEYGDQISTQYKKRKPNAVANQKSDHIHMPFMLQWNDASKMIELIPKTIMKRAGAWKAFPGDVVYNLESTINESIRIISEGGAAGHMAHPYDNYNLTFNDLKEIVSRALEGRLDIEEAVTEKTDGQNIQVTWKEGKIRFARNKTTIINPMTGDELVSDFKRKYKDAVDKSGESAAAGYKLIVDGYQACVTDLQEAFSKIQTERLEQIFKNGRVFANMEIIYPATKNVISYEKAHLQFHNLVEYNDSAQVVETDLSGGSLLQKIIREVNANLQKTFSFIPPQQLILGKSIDFEQQQNSLYTEIEQLQKKYNLQETDEIYKYRIRWWEDIIESKMQQLGLELTDEVRMILIKRWAFQDKSTNITKIKKMVDSEQFASWVSTMDGSESVKIHKQLMEPFESIFLRLGAIVLKNVQNLLAANPDKAIQQIKQDLSATIRDIQSSGNIKTIDSLKTQLKRLERIGGVNAIVPAEGLVFVYGGNTYKLTGAFAPINQILGVLKYAR